MNNESFKSLPDIYNQWVDGINSTLPTYNNLGGTVENPNITRDIETEVADIIENFQGYLRGDTDMDPFEAADLEVYSALQLL